MLEVEGFLSKEIITSLQGLKKVAGAPENIGDRKALELEVLAYDFNKLAMRVALLPYPLVRLSDFLTGVLFARLLQDYQAVLILAGRGMRAQARNMARSALESMFHCLAASENIELKKGRQLPIQYVDAALSAHDSFRLRQSKHLLELEALSTDTKLGIQRMMDEIRGKRPASINLEALAEDLGRSDWYSQHYRLLSQDSHPSITAMEHHISASDSQESVNAQFGQSYADFCDTITIAVMVLFEAICSIKSHQLTEEMSEVIEQDSLPLVQRLAVLLGVDGFESQPST